MSTVYVVSPDPVVYVDSLAEAKAELQRRLRDVGDNFNVELNGRVFTKSTEALQFLEKFRGLVESKTTTMSDTVYFYTNITTAIETAMFQNTQIDDIGGVWSKFTSYMLLLKAIDKLGIQRALGASYFATCVITNENRFWIRTLQLNSDIFIALAIEYFPALKTSHASGVSDLSPVTRRLTQRIDEVLDNNSSATCRERSDANRADVAQDFFMDMTTYLTHFQKIGNFALTEIVDDVVGASRDAIVNVVVYAAVATCVLLLSAALIAWYVRKIRGMISQIGKYAKSTTEKINEVSISLFQFFSFPWTPCEVGTTPLNLFRPLDQSSPSIEIFCHSLPLLAFKVLIPVSSVSHALFVNLSSTILCMCPASCSFYCNKNT